MISERLISLLLSRTTAAPPALVAASITALVKACGISMASNKTFSPGFNSHE